MLRDFLPRFNQRFGVPAAQPELAYRPMDSELDLGSVLCIKELRRVAKDNTVQYHGPCNSIPVRSVPGARASSNVSKLLTFHPSRRFIV